MAWFLYSAFLLKLSTLYKCGKLYKHFFCAFCMQVLSIQHSNSDRGIGKQTWGYSIFADRLEQMGIEAPTCSAS